ncbi:MAG: PRD domain-containing protein [Chloroflexi bacterium]|nr:PRD domain-containing protein [Chloroflexota bacterium]
MTALTTRQRDILRLLLDADAPVAAAELAQKMHLTPRQVGYGLRGLKQWLAHRRIELKVTPGVGVELHCSPAENVMLQRELRESSGLQLILEPRQRQQLLALLLLESGEPTIVQQWEQWLAVSRSTVLGDLDVVEAWLAGHGLELERRPNYGIAVCGAEQQIRQALGAWAWGDAAPGLPLTRLSHSHGVTFTLAEDAHLLPVVQRAAEVISRWKMRRLFGQVAYAEKQLGGRFSDDAVLFLALIFAIQTARIDRGCVLEEEPEEIAWLEAHPVWTVAEEMAGRLRWGVGAPWPRAEIASIARYLLAAPRNERWPGDMDIDASFSKLVDGLMRHISRSYDLPSLEHDRMLQDGIVVHTVSAYLRQRFGLWMPPPPAGTTLPKEYAFENRLARELAEQMERELGAHLLDGDIDNIALLLRAAYIRERPYRLSRVFVICPSGMASAQLLLARLRARFPRLGDPEVLSVRELTRRRLDTADLVITTIPLPPELHDSQKVIQVHHLLFPEDVEAITAWLAVR